MIRLTLAQMRRSRGRLAAGGLAIAISTAFVTVTLLAGGVLTATTQGAITASYGDADLVVHGWPITDRTLTAVATTEGVAAAEPKLSTVVQMVGPEGTLWIDVTAPPADPRLQAQVLLEGSLPDGGQVTLPDGIAATLGVGVGGAVQVAVSRYVEDDGVMDEYVELLEVAGIVDGTAASLYGGSMTALAGPGDVGRWVRDQLYPGDELTYRSVLVLVDDGAEVLAVQSAVAESVNRQGPNDLVVLTPAEQAAMVIEDLTGEAGMLTALALAFAGVALLVAALVISNTFQVLVAQRTRTLALLRCVGANRSQLRRSVISEAVALGAVAAFAGIAFGTTAVQAALMIVGRARPHLPLPTLAPVTVAVVVVPLVIGVLVTVVAALGPARAATRVSPLAALRPGDSSGIRAGRVRAVAAVLVTLFGAGLLALGVVSSRAGETTTGLGIAVLGGAVSFVGLLIGGVFWLPRLVGFVTRNLGRLGGPPARLAAANSTRNPRRVAATSNALLIGVTLVVMMATGAASARSAIAQRLDSEFPVDVEASAMGSAGYPEALPAQFAESVRALPGVAAVSELTTTNVTVAREGGPAVLEYQTALGADETVIEVVRSAAVVDPLEDGVMLVPRSLARYGIATGDVLVVTQAEPDPAESAGAPPGEGAGAVGGTLTVTAVVTAVPGESVLLTQESLGELAPEADPSLLWVKVSDRRDADVVPAIQSAAATSTGTGIQVIGPVVERASWEAMVDTMLQIVIGLLAVSVVIAIVGVANTLSLSVIERRRESATLRAVGLTRGQLRATLAWEGVVIALVGAVAGSVLGTVYGWLGAHTVLHQVGIVAFAVAWRELGLVLADALAAGLLALVLPSRSATRTEPVVALAVE